MREPLRSVDANLLLSLDALLEDRNLTHAGERLAMSQPAMSGALARLRKHFGDELLVRVGRGFELTPFAVGLRPLVVDAVSAAEALLGNDRGFEPEDSARRFTVSMSEYAMTVLAEPLTRTISARAPTCSIAIDAIDVGGEDFETQLLRRDLIIGPLGFDFPGERQPVFTDHLVCIIGRGNPKARMSALSIDDLRDMPHAVAAFRAAGSRPRPLEVELARHGLVDRVVQVQVTSLLTLPYAVSGTNLCAFVPARLAQRCAEALDLAVVETELDEIRITEAAHWHARRNDESAVVWLRHLLHEIAVAVEDEVRG